MSKKSINPISLVRDNIRKLAPYSTARDEYTGDIGIYLDANENPYDSGLNRYPDPRQKALKQRISEIKQIPVENIFIGNGSDEPIDLVYRVFCEPRVDNAISIAPTYGMYKVTAAINDVEVREVALRSDFTLDVDALLSAADKNSKLMFICSPNNPSGNTLAAKDIEKLLNNFNGMVILDEAYVDFADDKGFLSRLGEFPNLIILQTLSKAWGLAGLRLGLAFAQKEVIDVLSQVKYPYNINIVTQKMVLDELEEGIDEQLAEIISERKKVVEQLKESEIILKVYPSDSNFVLVKVENPRGVYNTLIDNGVIVRDRSRIKGCEGCLRITIGTPEENSKMLSIIKDL